MKTLKIKLLGIKQVIEKNLQIIAFSFDVHIYLYKQKSRSNCE